jgi:hypothetical protein
MPELGQTVLVRTHPDAHQGAEVAPAIVTRVWPATEAQDATDFHGPIPAQPESINVQVLGDNVGGISWRHHVRYVSDLTKLEDGVHPHDVYSDLVPVAAPQELAK